MYLYHENLTARPMLWLWTLRDVAFIGIGLLLSVLALTQASTVNHWWSQRHWPFSAFGTAASACWTFCATPQRSSFSGSNTTNGGNESEKEEAHAAAGGH